MAFVSVLVSLVRRLLSVVYLMSHPAVPLWLKLLPVLALAYFFWPNDLVPDYGTIFPLGFVDDFIVGYVLMRVFTWKAWAYAAASSRQRRKAPAQDAVTVDFKVLDEDREPSEANRR